MEETLWKIAKEAECCASVLCTTTKRVANCTTEVYGFCEEVTSIAPSDIQLCPKLCTVENILRCHALREGSKVELQDWDSSSKVAVDLSLDGLSCLSLRRLKRRRRSLRRSRTNNCSFGLMVGHPYFFGGASGTGEMSGHLIPEHSASSKDVPCTHLSLSDAEFSILSVLIPFSSSNLSVTLR